MHRDKRINVSHLIQNLQKGSNPKQFVINSVWDEHVGVNKWVSLFRTVFTSHKMTSRQTHKCVTSHAEFINGAKSKIICQCFTSCRVPPDSTRHTNKPVSKGVWQVGCCWDELKVFFLSPQDFSRNVVLKSWKITCFSGRRTTFGFHRVPNVPEFTTNKLSQTCNVPPDTSQENKQFLKGVWHHSCCKHVGGK